jgi:hypothetical protein
MSQLVRLYQLVQGTDAPPTPAMEAAARTVFADLEALRARGERLLAGSPAGR